MADPTAPEGRFMVAVGAIVEHRGSGRILLLKRSDQADYMGGVWEDITGRMKQFEEPEDALRREVREECGLEIEIVKPLKVFHLYRGARTADNELVGIIYWCRSRSDQVVLSHEHSDYRWLTPQEALRMVEDPGIKSDIETLLREQQSG
jgi:8-oxo-dGTP diphosphatase